ncbi:TSUP family transporter [Bisgaard Taxon 10/6]|uniref:TSUP family transporter n=1 Tax=Exercitatus varius TaxID=67857 RepID=UPI0018A69F8A|nr:TSUP family transporter [Exercitatus varius]QOF66825.1 TSUP family transporter [Actinobacillus sp. GY-402]MDG2915200.1 TSUP family transporter [Exercitatus varius]MDG2942334.1 TSUP family transporter [Exercitatus varius]MDG2948875.1 TSUP family transporter [Exercitatus varius]MDG2953232.1 TSUP family transporter [Exercitatus varius]
MEISVELIGILFVVAMIAGFIDALAGGGGLITIPALLMTGMPPAMALGTNKLQSCGGSFSASLYFIRRKAVDLGAIWFILLCTFTGSAIGSVLIQLVDSSLIKKAIPFLVLAVGLYFLLTPKLGEEDRRQRLSFRTFALTAAFGLGFYDGFFGPGTGSILSLVFVTLLGFNLTKATAYAKVLNFTSNIASLICFLIGGQIVWSVGIVMMCGQIVGAHLGAKMVLSKGKRLIRPMVVLMSFVMTAKMAYEQGWFG